MTEQQPTDRDASTEERAPGSQLMEELQSLGKEMATAIRALWDSEDSRKLREEIGDGFVELGQQIDTAVKSAQESDAAKQFSTQVKETMDKARESDVAGKVEEGLVTGLRELNKELSKLVGSLEDREKDEARPEEPGDPGAEAETDA
jgi:hypothetical protein